jgi:hypothetical protein
MRSPTVRLLLLLALVGALAVAPMLSAAQCVICVTGRTTSPSGAPTHWGIGDSCAQAQQNLRNQIFAAADLDCENDLSLACNVQVVYTAACWYKASIGKYVSDGYGNYGCYEDDPACY